MSSTNPPVRRIATNPLTVVLFGLLAVLAWAVPVGPALTVAPVVGFVISCTGVIENRGRPTRKQAFSVTFSVLMVTSVIGGAALVSTQPVTQDEAGSAEAAIAGSSGPQYTLATQDIQFADSFENESADSGVPKNWEAVTDPLGRGHTRNVDAERVTNKTAYSGSQSYYARESESSNAVTTRPSEQPYTNNVTLSQTAAIRLENTSSGASTRSISYDFYEETGQNPNIRVAILKNQSNDGRLVYHNSTGSPVTLDEDVDQEEWVKLRVYDIDPANNTYSVSWESEDGDSGTKTDLPMWVSMTDGYTQNIININGGGWVDAYELGNASTGLGGNVTVRVTDQNGNPVANSTVDAYGVNTDRLNSTVDDLEARSDELLDQASNPRPNSWEPDKALVGSNGLMGSAEQNYVAVHRASQWGFGGPSDFSSLDDPILSAPANEEIVLTVWNPTDEGLVEDDVDTHLPGATTSGTIVVEQLDHTGDVVSKDTLETEDIYELGYGFGKTHEGVRTELPPGFYRVYPEGSPSTSYVVMVGDPASVIAKDLKTEANQLSQQAQDVRARISQGKFARQTVTTNESGYATIDVRSGVQILGIQAYKADGSLVDASNPDPAALRELRASGFDGAIYLSTEPKRVNLNTFGAKNDTAQVTVRKWTATPFSNVTQYQDLAERLENQLLNETTADLEATFEDRLDEVKRGNLEQRWADLLNLLRSNPDARERYLEETGRDDLPSVEGLSDKELRQSLRAAQSALATQPSTGAAGDTTTDVSDGVADFQAILTGQYEPDDIAVFAHYSNGTTRTVADEYVSVDQSLTGAQTEIQVTDYPVGEQDPAQVTFEVKAANGNGVDSVRDSIVNPAFGGEVPNIEAVDVSTFRPGPSETVSVSLRPSPDSSYGSLKDVRVYGPSGTELNATLDGERASFETNGQGTHTIRATYTDSTGAEFVETIRVDAKDATTNPPPTVRIEDGGDTVIAGSGLRSARVEETPDGKRVTAVVPGDGDRPGAVHVRGSDAFSGDMTVNVVQGDLEEGIDKHVSVVIHTQLPEGALVYRDGRSQPITRDGSTQYGEVEERTGDDGSTKHIIRTYSDASGQLQLEVSRDPGFVERTLYDFRTSGIPLPSIGMLFNAVVIYDEIPEPPAVVTDTLEQPLLDEAGPGEIVSADPATAMKVAT